MLTGLTNLHPFTDCGIGIHRFSIHLIKFRYLAMAILVRYVNHLSSEGREKWGESLFGKRNYRSLGQAL